MNEFNNNNNGFNSNNFDGNFSQNGMNNNNGFNTYNQGDKNEFTYTPNKRDQRARKFSQA